MEIHERVAGHSGKYDTLLEIVKKTKLRWFGHAVRAKGTLAQNNLRGKVESKISRGRPARQWLDDVTGRTGQRKCVRIVFGIQEEDSRRITTTDTDHID